MTWRFRYVCNDNVLTFGDEVESDTMPPRPLAFSPCSRCEEWGWVEVQRCPCCGHEV